MYNRNVKIYSNSISLLISTQIILLRYHITPKIFALRILGMGMPRNVYTMTDWLTDWLTNWMAECTTGLSEFLPLITILQCFKETLQKKLPLLITAIPIVTTYSNFAIYVAVPYDLISNYGFKINDKSFYCKHVST